MILTEASVMGQRSERGGEEGEREEEERRNREEREGIVMQLKHSIMNSRITYHS